MTENFSNWYATTLVGAVDDNDTALEVASPLGSPAANFRIVVQNGEEDPTNRELMIVTAKSADDFTVTRGAEGTTPMPHPADSFIAHVVTAASLIQAILDRITAIDDTILVELPGTPGAQVDVMIDYAAQIESWTLLADVSGSIVVDIWKDTYANYPPANADSITGSTPPTITTAIKATDDDLTGWDAIIDPGDILRFNVDSATTIGKVTVALKVTRV
jgi:hypothetical protein